MHVVRGIVSKKKKRFRDTEAGFDLDLSYITDRIIAMGFPSEGTEAMYRNPLTEVQRFFETRHAGHYKIFNLCSERVYRIEGLFPHVQTFPFDDHNPAPLETIAAFCESVDKFLLEDEKNVVAIHCKAGKGRTGLMVACYLLHCGACATAAGALELFGQRRTVDGKGVTIPSQKRFVYYYDQSLRHGIRDIPAISKTLRVTAVRFISIPDFDIKGGCDPYFLVDLADRGTPPATVYDYRDHVEVLQNYRPKDRVALLDVASHNLLVRGNARFAFFDRDWRSPDDQMFHFWIHTAFVEGNFLSLHKSVLDRACKDSSNREFRKYFTCEIYFEEVDDVPLDVLLGRRAT